MAALQRSGGTAPGDAGAGAGAEATRTAGAGQRDMHPRATEESPSSSSVPQGPLGTQTVVNASKGRAFTGSARVRLELRGHGPIADTPRFRPLSFPRAFRTTCPHRVASPSPLLPARRSPASSPRVQTRHPDGHADRHLCQPLLRFSHISLSVCLSNPANGQQLVPKIKAGKRVNLKKKKLLTCDKQRGNA